MALTAYGVVAAFQPSHEFGRVLAAYGGAFIVGSLLWSVAFDGFQPDRADLLGAAICLVGVALIIYARWSTLERPAVVLTVAAPRRGPPRGEGDGCGRGAHIADPSVITSSRRCSCAVSPRRAMGPRRGQR